MKSILFSACFLAYLSLAFDTQPRLPKLTLRGHNDDVMSLAFSSDGKSLASGSLDKTVIIWDVQSGQIKKRFTKHKGWVWSLAFSPDGSKVASSSYDTSDVWVWDSQTGEPKQQLKPYVSSLVFSTSGESLVGADDKALYRWDVQTWKRDKTPSVHTESIYVIVLSSDGKFLASGDSGGTIILWDTKSWQPIQKTRLKNWVKSLAFFPDGKKLVIGGAVMDKVGSQIGGEISTWNVSDQSPGTLMKSPDVVWAVSVSPNGKLIAGAGKDGKIKIWDSQTEKLKETFDGHSKLVSRVVFSPDGNLLASCGGDGAVKLWEISGLY